MFAFFNCLRSGHMTKWSRFSRRKHYKGRHNTRLHVDRIDKSRNTEFQDPMPSSLNSVALPVKVAPNSLPTHNQSNVVLSCNTPSHRDFFLRFTVHSVSESGEQQRWETTKVLLDSGSTANLITEDLFKKLVNRY